MYTLLLTFTVIFALIRGVFRILLEDNYIENTIKKNNIGFYRKNITFFYELLPNYYQSKSLDKDIIRENIKEIGRSLVDYKLDRRLKSYISELIKIDVKFSNAILFEIDKLLQELIISTKNTKSISEIDDLNLYHYIYFDLGKIYIKNKNYLKYYHSYLSGVIYHIEINNLVDQGEKRKYIEKKLDHNSRFLFLSDESKKQFKKEKALTTIKALIKDEGIYFESYLKYYIKKLILNNEYLSNNPSEVKIHLEILLVLFIYSYYVVFFDDFSENYRKQFEELITNKIPLEGNKTVHIFSDILRDCKDEIWMYYKNIEDELSNNNWERIPLNRVKAIIMPFPVKDFYLKYTESVIKTDIDSDNFPDLNYYEIVNLLKYYEDGVFKNNESLDKFCDYFNIDKKESTQRVSYLYKLLNKKLKELEIRKTDKAINQLEDIETNVDYLLKKYKKDLSNSKFYNQVDNNRLTKKIEDTEVDITYLLDNLEIYEDYMTRAMDLIMRDILVDICKDVYQINLRELKKESSYELVNWLRENDEITNEFNTLIGTPLNEFWEFTFSSSEKDYKLIEDFNAQLNHIETRFPYPTVILCDAVDRIRIDFHKIQIREYTDEEVAEKIKVYLNGEKKYYIPTINNLKIAMDEEEAKNYIKKRYRYLSIELKADYEIDKDRTLCLCYHKNYQKID